MFPIVPDLQKLSITPAIPDVALPSAAVEMSKSVANVALDRISSVQERASASAIPSAAVDISKSLATVVAAGTNVATETGTRAISSLFGKLGGVMSMASASPTTEDQGSICEEDKSVSESEETYNEVKTESKLESILPKKSTKVKTDSFYELPIRDKDDFTLNTMEKTIFEDFSSNSSLSVDPDMLQLLSNHYRNSMESDENDEIEWKTLQNILLRINSEDAVLGVSLILSEILEKYHKFETIEEIVDKGEQCEKPEINENEPNEMHENDGWENDWSDPDLSGLSEDEETEQQNDETTTRTVNVAQNLVDNIVNHNKDDKSRGAELALYVTSLALLLEETNISPDVAFRLPYKAVLAIANKYKNSQLKCDNASFDSKNENECDYSIIKLLSKTIDTAKSIETQNE